MSPRLRRVTPIIPDTWLSSLLFTFDSGLKEKLMIVVLIRIMDLVMKVVTNSMTILVMLMVTNC